jgi:UDP-N-acetylglucosamine--N-acetylmuramyl-(pentapeptide) pyrophosphoryl-undecaprenol N-acetylglucosamine transferase
LAVAEVLAERGDTVTFVGTAGGIEARVVPGAGFPLRVLPGEQLRGGGVGRAVRGVGAAARGTVGALGLLRELRPELVVGVGGYASVALVVGAWLRRIPAVLLEQNVVPGAANRMLARLARRVCVGFEATAASFRPGLAAYTGNPIRAGVLRALAARTPHERPALLVFGGSAGARRLNRATVDAVPLLRARGTDLDVRHQTGTQDVDEVRAAYARLGVPARVEPFIGDMGAAYAAADLVVARAGAMTCAEVTAAGLPALLVPYPHAADDHQRRNAEVLAAAGAAEIIPDHQLDGARLAAALAALLEDPAKRTAMAAQARALGRPDAATRVVDECVAVARAR